MSTTASHIDTVESREGSFAFWKQLKKRRLVKWSVRILMGLLFIAVFADFIAGDKPIYCKVDQKSYFPVFISYGVEMGIRKWPKELINADWKALDYERKILPLIPYSPLSLDLKNSHFKGPFDKQSIESWRYRHWMGTDELGRDVAAGLVHGTRVALWVGIGAMVIASLLGIVIGVFAGYFGDRGLKASYVRIGLNIVGLFLAWQWAFAARSYYLLDSGRFGTAFLVSLILFIGVLLVVNLLSTFLERFTILKKRIPIPLDLIIMRFIELFNSIPGLLVLIVLLAIIQESSLLYLIVIIGVLSWTGIARFLRGELLRIRSMEYVEAVQAMGFPKWRIVMKHALPNALTPVLITVAFGVAGAILAEATLSFLGIGVPLEKVTWGSLLTEARKSPSAWWLALFPGLAIFVTVTIFNLIGDGLSDVLDPKRKQV